LAASIRSPRGLCGRVETREPPVAGFYLGVGEARRRQGRFTLHATVKQQRRRRFLKSVGRLSFQKIEGDRRLKFGQPVERIQRQARCQRLPAWLPTRASGCAGAGRWRCAASKAACQRSRSRRKSSRLRRSSSLSLRSSSMMLRSRATGISLLLTLSRACAGRERKRRKDAEGLADG
jgi:hypothetical protein